MEPVLRALGCYLLLLIVVRLSGKRGLAQVTIFDLILLLLISQTVGQALIGDDSSLTTAAIITVTLLLVTAAFALALVMPAWGAGLIVTGVMAAVVAVVAGLSWRRRVRRPLATSRTALARDIRFTKERFA